jgi:hypothetical protein
LFLNGGVRYQTQIRDLVKGGFNSLIDLTASKLKVEKDAAEQLILSPDKLNAEQKILLQGSFEVNYESLYQEIRNILDYYSQNLNKTGETQSKEESFSGIYLYGQGAKLFHLKTFLEKKEVEIKDRSVSKSDVSPMFPFISRESLPENLVILGLSLRNLGSFRELRDINLVPEKIQSKYLQVSIYSSLYAYLKIIFWSVYIVGIILIFAYVLTLFYHDNVKEELKSIENVAESPANTELRRDISTINETAQKIELLTATQLDWDMLFGEFSKAKPAGIRINNMLVSEDPEAWKTIAGEGRVLTREGFIYMVVNGTADTRESLKLYVDNLDDSEIFSDVKMPISSFESNKNLEFSVYCLIDTSKL